MQALAAKTLRHRTQIPLLFTSGLLVGQRFQVTAILALAELLRQAQQTLAVDIAHVIGDFLDAGDLEALAHLDRAHELGRLEQGLVCACVEPGAAPAEPLDGQQFALEIDIVEVRYLEFTARRGF